MMTSKFICNSHLSLWAPLLKLQLGTEHSTGIRNVAIVVVHVESLSGVRFFATPWTSAYQASLSLTISQSLLTPMSIESVMPFNLLILCRPFFLLSSVFPGIRVFPVSWLFASGDQSIGGSASASALQGWFPLGLTGLISLMSKGLSRVLSSTTIQKHQFFRTQPSLWSNSHTHTWLLKKP